MSSSASQSSDIFSPKSWQTSMNAIVPVVSDTLLPEIAAKRKPTNDSPWILSGSSSDSQHSDYYFANFIWARDILAGDNDYPRLDSVLHRELARAPVFTISMGANVFEKFRQGETLCIQRFFSDIRCKFNEHMLRTGIKVLGIIISTENSLNYRRKVVGDEDSVEYGIHINGMKCPQADFSHVASEPEKQKGWFW